MVEIRLGYTSPSHPLQAPEASADFRHSTGHWVGYIPASGTNVVGQVPTLWGKNPTRGEIAVFFHSTSIQVPCLAKTDDGISSLGMVSDPKNWLKWPKPYASLGNESQENHKPVPLALESWSQQVWGDSNITPLINGKTIVFTTELSEKHWKTRRHHKKCMINIVPKESLKASSHPVPKGKKRSSPRGMMACAPAWRTQASKGCK